MERNKFIIICNKCGSNDVMLAASHDQTVILDCRKCGNMDEEE